MSAPEFSLASVAKLESSGLDAEHARKAGVVPVAVVDDLPEEFRGFYLAPVPGMLFPWRHPVTGEVDAWQYRPDVPVPRRDDGKPVKYVGGPVNYRGFALVRAAEGTPRMAVICEGTIQSLMVARYAKPDVAVYGIAGCTGWSAGQGPVPELYEVDWPKDVTVLLDGDAAHNYDVYTAGEALAAALEPLGTETVFAKPPMGGTNGVDDWLARVPEGKRVAALTGLIENGENKPAPRKPKPDRRDRSAKTTPAPSTAPADAAGPIPLAAAHEVFRRWLGTEYDMDALDATLCTLAAERLDGDPLWLLVISGAGNAKTETVQAAAGTGAIVISTISSEAGLLSGTPEHERSADATGGLLHQVGERGVLVIKDVTSILSMHRDQRAAVLAALREVYDGYWRRDVGTDGGRTLDWKGRLGVVGAVTTAWDAAHSVIAAMGDRFVLLRVDSGTGRAAAGRRAIGNTGSEKQMRAELSQAVARVIAGMDAGRDLAVTDDETERLLRAADLTTRARTAVEFDYRGNVIDAHAPEMPTRFAKQLTQLMRGGLSLGMSRNRAMRLALRCARDSMPPMRLAIIDDVAEHPGAPTNEVRKRIDKPRATVDRQLQALHMLGVLTCEETPVGLKGSTWRYRLAEGIDPTALDVPEMSEQISTSLGREDREGESGKGVSDIPGTSRTAPDLHGSESTLAPASPAGPEPADQDAAIAAALRHLRAVPDPVPTVSDQEPCELCEAMSYAVGRPAKCIDHKVAR